MPCVDKVLKFPPFGPRNAVITFRPLDVSDTAWLCATTTASFVPPVCVLGPVIVVWAVEPISTEAPTTNLFLKSGVVLFIDRR